MCARTSEAAQRYGFWGSRSSGTRAGSSALAGIFVCADEGVGASRFGLAGRARGATSGAGRSGKSASFQSAGFASGASRQSAACSTVPGAGVATGFGFVVAGATVGRSAGFAATVGMGFVAAVGAGVGATVRVGVGVGVGVVTGAATTAFGAGVASVRTGSVGVFAELGAASTFASFVGSAGGCTGRASLATGLVSCSRQAMTPAATMIVDMAATRNHPMSEVELACGGRDEGDIDVRASKTDDIDGRPGGSDARHTS